MSKLRSPRFDCSMTIGTSWAMMSWWSMMIPVVGAQPTSGQSPEGSSSRSSHKEKGGPETSGRPSPLAGNVQLHFHACPSVDVAPGYVVDRDREVVGFAANATGRFDVEQIVGAEGEVEIVGETGCEEAQLGVSVEDGLQLRVGAAENVVKLGHVAPGHGHSDISQIEVDNADRFPLRESL